MGQPDYKVIAIQASKYDINYVRSRGGTVHFAMEYCASQSN